jgi:hypothetical protein
MIWAVMRALCILVCMQVWRAQPPRGVRKLIEVPLFQSCATEEEEPSLSHSFASLDNFEHLSVMSPGADMLGALHPVRL